MRAQTNKIYKIYDTRTGLYKCRGGYRWSKKGSIWEGIGPLKNHLRLGTDLRGERRRGSNGEGPYEFEEHWEIHEFVVETRNTGHLSVRNFLQQNPTKSR